MIQAIYCPADATSGYDHERSTNYGKGFATLEEAANMVKSRQARYCCVEKFEIGQYPKTVMEYTVAQTISLGGKGYEIDVEEYFVGNKVTVVVSSRSGYVESLTEETDRVSYSRRKLVDRMGDMIRAKYYTEKAKG